MASTVVVATILRVDRAVDASVSAAPLAAAAERGTRRAHSRLVRVAHAPLSWLVVLVGLSALARAGLGALVPSAWILPDELLYSELSKSIAAGHLPAVRGVPVFGLRLDGLLLTRSDSHDKERNHGYG